MNRILKKRLQDTRASLEADLAPLQEQLAATQKAVDEIQEAIAEIDRMLPDAGSAKRGPAVAVAPRPTGYGEVPELNGSAKDLTRRQLIRRIVPQFHGEDFSAGDVRNKFLEQYLEVEPSNFRQALNNLLQKMAEQGDTIEKAGRKGDSPTAPWLYRQIQNQEESLNLGH